MLPLPERSPEPPPLEIFRLLGFGAVLRTIPGRRLHLRTVEPHHMHSAPTRFPESRSNHANVKPRVRDHMHVQAMPPRMQLEDPNTTKRRTRTLDVSKRLVLIFLNMFYVLALAPGERPEIELPCAHFGQSRHREFQSEFTFQHVSASRIDPRMISSRCVPSLQYPLARALAFESPEAHSPSPHD